LLFRRRYRRSPALAHYAPLSGCRASFVMRAHTELHDYC
jgi:hypothetical protein